MNTEWQTFLSQQGAQLKDGRVVAFNDSAPAQVLEQDLICDLSHQALIRADGEECSDFLQGQLSNDIRQVNDSRHQLGSYCTPKGRILALFRIFKREDSYYLSLPQELLEPSLKRLRMFVLRSKVTLEATDQLIGIGLAGPGSESLLRAQLGALPAEADESVTQQGITVLRMAGVQPRFELYGELEAMRALWQALITDCQAVGAGAWDLLNIHAGLPQVLPQNSEAFVPQMLNLQLVNGVNFKKGCYTGQEVVARMQYLGKLKRRMYLAHVDTRQQPEAGDELSSPQSASGQGAGKVVLVAPAAEGGYDLLVVTEISVAESGQLYLHKDETQPLTLLPMPYDFE
jgi:folate-binding protein YgfZ